MHQEVSFARRSRAATHRRTREGHAGRAHRSGRNGSPRPWPSRAIASPGTRASCGASWCARGASWAAWGHPADNLRRQHHALHAALRAGARRTRGTTAHS